MIRKLGQGGMGSVYLALDTALENQVAVKANRNPAAESANQFLREARLLASLRHPNLPRVTDYFILDGAQYLVMDYIPGADLAGLLKEKGTLPPGEVLGWAKQLGSAVAYMHRQAPPVIHRDIKPGNIRISQDGEAVLVDFGIARTLSAEQATETGAKGYTQGFAPPEQYGDSARTSPASDQYALAATLYTLLAGQKPVDAIQRMIGQAALTPLRVLVPGIPAQVEMAIEKGLSLRPEQRFATIDDFTSTLLNPAVDGAVLSWQGQPAVQADATAPTLSGKTASSDPAATPTILSPRSRRGGFTGWVKIALGGLLLAGIALLSLGGFFLFSRMNRAAMQPSATPPLPGQVTLPVVQVAIRPSSTVEAVLPVFTAPAPPATDTPQPSPTLEDISTLPAPSATFLPLGGGGILAFSSDRGDGKTMQIWTVRVALNDQGQAVTADLRQITQGEGSKTQPRWSPDGNELLYVAPGGENLGLDIFKIKADGSQPGIDLTRRKGDDTEPAWAPDGRVIAFTNNGREDGVRQLLVMNADGSGAYRLSFDQEEFGPAWSPDMRFLAFVMNASGMQILHLREQTRETSAATPYYVTPQRFDYTTLKGSLGQVAQPAWSPDGGWIAFTRQDGARERVGIARYPVKNPDQDVVLLTGGTRDSSPSWAPDSQWIAFTSNRDGNLEVYVMRANGQSQLNISTSPGRDQDPAWRPR